MEKTLEQNVESMLSKFVAKVEEKMEREDFQTEMVHEDIRIMHHIVKIRDELKIDKGDKFYPIQLDDFRNSSSYKEKLLWIKSIGAEFPEPIKFIYFFGELGGTYNLSERDVNATSLDELKMQYDQNKIHSLEVIAERKRLQDGFRADAEHE